MRYSNYKYMFLIGALWNLLGGILSIPMTGWIFATANLQPPHPGVYYYSWIALFMTFGVGYYMVYRDPERNRNIVILGIIGKLAFASIALYNFANFPGQVPRVFLAGVIGDLVFVVLFWKFLRSAPRSQASPSPSNG